MLATSLVLGALLSGCGSCSCRLPDSDALMPETEAAPGTDAVPGTDAGPDVTYSAMGLATALDRIVIVKADFDRDLCMQIVLASPSGATQPWAVTTPFDWGVESIALNPGVVDCMPFVGSPDMVWAVNASGVIDFTADPITGYPCALAIVDVIAMFPPDAPWVPTDPEPFLAFDIPIDDGC